ncbi:MAG: exo-alpha-sialidase [Gammaproteobacteria bacterium]|nr:exo-alpha-sialidase [Gammaproteobacteria bacterium]
MNRIPGICAIAALAVSGLAVSGLAVSALAGPAGALAQAQPLISPPTPAEFAAVVPHWKTEEYLLIGDSMRGGGEPMIAVNPTDPKNIVVVAMANVQELGGEPLHENGTDAFHAAPYSTVTRIAVTRNGGVTWKLDNLPILSGRFTRCPDAFVAVTQRGEFLAGCEPRETSGGFLGESALVISTDKGRTWSKPVSIISDYQLGRFARGVQPLSGHGRASPWDRPFLFIDDSTGTIYGQAGGGLTRVGAPPGKFRWQAYVTASTDGGHSFGTIYPWDSPQYPQLSRGIGMAAGHGALAVIYVAASAPGARSACPCGVFGLSRSQGRDFEYRLLPPMSFAPASALGRPQRDAPGPTALAADPSKAGHYAVLEYDPSGPRYEVILTEDYGRTWSAPILAAATAGAAAFTRPTFQYSAAGALALAWRAIYPKSFSYNIWAAVSKDGGHSFSTPLRISHARSPAVDPYRNAGLFGDDIQDLALGPNDLYVVWADNRAGFQGVWLGRAPLSAFTFAAR